MSLLKDIARVELKIRLIMEKRLLDGVPVLPWTYGEIFNGRVEPEAKEECACLLGCVIIDHFVGRSLRQFEVSSIRGDIDVYVAAGEALNISSSAAQYAERGFMTGHNESFSRAPFVLENRLWWQMGRRLRDDYYEFQYPFLEEGETVPYMTPTELGEQLILQRIQLGA